jgi:hypothetical protein
MFQDFKIIFLIVDYSKKISKNMTFAEAWRRARNSIKEANAELRRKTKRIPISRNSSIQITKTRVTETTSSTAVNLNEY